MLNNQKELFAVKFAVKFAESISRLKSIGLKADIVVTAGVVMVSTADKNSAKCFRKAIKDACAKTGAMNVETRPRKGFYVFTIAI